MVEQRKKEETNISENNLFLRNERRNWSDKNNRACVCVCEYVGGENVNAH